MHLPCVILRNGQPFIHGYVIGAVPASPYWSAGAAESQSCAFVEGYSSLALVLLETFDKGTVVEKKWTDIKIVSSIEKAEEWCKPI
jgi:hypothetical protein